MAGYRWTDTFHSLQGLIHSLSVVMEYIDPDSYYLNLPDYYRFPLSFFLSLSLTLLQQYYYLFHYIVPTFISQRFAFTRRRKVD